MVEMLLHLLDRKVGLPAQLTHHLLRILRPLEPAAVAVVGLLLGHLRESVAGEVETGVAGVAVQHLVRVVVVTAETNLAVRLEKFLTRQRLLALHRLGQPLTLQQQGQLVLRLVLVPVREVLQHRAPHQVLANPCNLRHVLGLGLFRLDLPG